MRYVLTLFLIFLSCYTYSVFAAEPPHPDGCVSKNFYGGQQATVNATKASCASNAAINLIKSWTDANTPYVRCMTCTNPCFPGQVYNSATKTCACPEGTSTVTGFDGKPSCKVLEPEEPENCPSGFPPVNGSCPVCPGGQNPDGTCIDPTQCGPGETKQGEINGTAVCAGSCSDPNQSWGFVNGVEGCYGAPSCPNGGSYGSVNGVSGCYGSNSSSGSNTSSGSGSNTSSGTGTGGDGSGSNTSSGSGTGTGGDGSGSTPGGGGGSPSNNSIGAPYPVDVPCEENFEKVGFHCVSAGQGDCITGYHELVVSRDPFLFICVANDIPPPEIPASSQAASSSQPNSSAPSSSQNSSSPNTGGAGGSSGSNTSSGSGSGSGSGGEGSGECDPSAPDYLSCISGSSDTEITDLKLAAYTGDMAARLQQSKDKYTQTIQNIQTQFESQMSVNIGGGSSGLPSQTITLYGQSFEAGIAARADFFELIRWAFFAAASILSLYILLSR